MKPTRARRSPRPTREQLQYLAGFFDGEGCVQSDGKKVNVTNTYPEVLRTFSRFFGGRIAAHNGTRKHVYRWSVGGRDARHFLRRMLPYLQEKRPQALLFLQVKRFSPRSAMREFLHRLLKELKHINYTTH